MSSPLDHGGFFISDLVSVVLNISVLPVASGDVHGSDIIGMAQTRRESPSDGVEVMRHPSPLGNLNTEGFFNQSGGNSISHSNSFLLTIFTGGRPIPIPWIDIVVELMSNIDRGNNHKPHTE